MSAPLFVVHVTKYGESDLARGIVGWATGFQHRAEGAGTGTCRVCRRIVIRGKGRWWE